MSRNSDSTWEIDIKRMAAVFGERSKVYGCIFNDIASDLTKERYSFVDNEEYESRSCDSKNGREYLGRIYWTEILYRAHMASVAAIFRTARWIQVAVREYDAGSLYGCASACRSLIESAGDIVFSLGAVPLTLAQNKNEVNAEISGQVSGTLWRSSELEDSLIHFTHARKVKNGEKAPDSHRAEHSQTYINYIDRMEIPYVKYFYAELCEIVHPAAMSVHANFIRQGEEYIASLHNDMNILEYMIVKRRNTISDVIMASFNSPLIILKVLHYFNIFTKLSGMEKYNLENIPQWGKVNSLLKS